MNRSIIILALVLLSTPAHFAQNSILTSQVGYELGYPIRVMVRSDQADYLLSDAVFEVINMSNQPVLKGQVENWGKKWESYWWTADLSQIEHQGSYIVKIKNKDQLLLTSDTIEVGRNLLWAKCFHTIAFDFLHSRAKQARTGKGWKDCGGDLQEFSSHVVAVNALCDILETSESNTDPL